MNCARQLVCIFEVAASTVYIFSLSILSFSTSSARVRVNQRTSSSISLVRFKFCFSKVYMSACAELPLYLLLGGLCGVVSVIFTRMTDYFTHMFEFLRDRIGIPATVTPAIGGLVTGLIALRYPGVLYWGFTNVDEILHSGKTATAPGQGLLIQLICAKVLATSFSKGSGLVGGVYAPSLFIGAAVGSVYGTMAGKAINAAMPGHDTVAHPQAYALVLISGSCILCFSSDLKLSSLSILGLVIIQQICVSPC